MQAIDEIVPTLLHALEDDKTSDTALDGLKQILRYIHLYIIPLLSPLHPSQSPLFSPSIHVLFPTLGYSVCLFQCQDSGCVASYFAQIGPSSPFVRPSFSTLSVINVFSIVHHLNLCLFSAFNAHALGALAEVAGPGLNSHLGIVLPALLSAMVGDDKVCNKD